MKRAVIAGALALSAAGCDRPTPTEIEHRAPPPQRVEFRDSVGEVRTDAKVYWKNDTTLWVLDDIPEIGIGSHFHRWELLESNRLQIQDLGMRLFRQTLYWKDAEADRGSGGSYSMRIHTHAGNVRDNVREARKLGLEPVIVVHGMPNLPEDVLARLHDVPFFLDRFAVFLGEMARAMPEVRFWEIWNEADVGHWGIPFGSAWNGRGFDRYEQGYNYGKLLQMAYPKIKEANPNAWVIANSVTGHESFVEATPGIFEIDGKKRSWNFLRGMYDAGGRDSYDFLAAHNYADQRSFAADLRAGLAQVGDPHRPVWLTEFGASALDYMIANDGVLPHERGLDDGATFDRAATEYWTRAIQEIQAERLFDVALGYNLFAVDGEAPEGARLPAGMERIDYGHGLLRRDAVTPKPVYHAVKAGQYNARIFAEPLFTAQMRLWAPHADPVGVRYEREGGYVTLYGIEVDRLVPTEIRFKLRETVLNEGTPGASSVCGASSGVVCPPR